MGLSCHPTEHTPGIAFQHLPPRKEGCRKPVLGVCPLRRLRNFSLVCDNPDVILVNLDPFFRDAPPRSRFIYGPASKKTFEVSRTNLKSAVNRSFHFQAAKIWNSLPTNVRSSLSLSSFNKNQKTHHFKERFCLLVCKTPFLHSLTVDWMCICRGGGVNNHD